MVEWVLKAYNNYVQRVYSKPIQPIRRSMAKEGIKLDQTDQVVFQSVKVEGGVNFLQIVHEEF